MKKLTLILICLIFCAAAALFILSIFKPVDTSVKQVQQSEAEYDVVGQWVTTQYIIADRGVESVDEINSDSFFYDVFNFYNDGTAESHKGEEGTWKYSGNNQFVFTEGNSDFPCEFVNADTFRLKFLEDNTGACAYYVYSRAVGPVEEPTTFPSFTDEELEELQKALNDLMGEN